MHRSELFPGVFLNYRYETRFKTEYLSVNFLCPPGLCPPAELALLSSMRKETAAHPAEEEIEKALLDLYGAYLGVRGYRLGETFVLPFSLTVHADRFLPEEPDGVPVTRKARALLFELLFSPRTVRGRFPKEAVEAAKKNRLDRLKDEKNDHYRYAVQQCLHLLCPGEPIDLPSSVLRSGLKKATARSVTIARRTIFEKAPVEVFYFGTQSEEALREELSFRLAPLKSEKVSLMPDRQSLAQNAPFDRKQSVSGVSSILCLGFRTDLLPAHPLFPAYCLMREIFCDAPVSLLFSTVREKMGLCYFCSGVPLSGKGIYMIASGIEKRSARQAQNAILSQLSRIREGDFPDELTENCKRSIVNALSELRDDPAESEEWALRGVLRDQAGDPDAFAKRILRVTKEEIVQAAESLTYAGTFLLEAGAPKTPRGKKEGQR